MLDRAGRAAARPFARELAAWQQTATLLGAKLEHARVKQQPTDAYVTEITQLTEAVTTALKCWRDTLSGDDASGHVADAERSAQTLLDLLASLRHRA